MLASRISKVLLSTVKKQIVPKPPKFLSGQLQPFRFQFENSQLYSGYSFDQLYGVKIGKKHPPAVKAQMAKDTIACLLLFFGGLALTLQLEALSMQEIEQVRRVHKSQQSKKVQLPPATHGKYKN